MDNEKIWDAKALGVELLRLRKAAGLSQHAAGKIVGVSHQQISNYEHGRGSISAERYETLRRGLMGLASLRDDRKSKRAPTRKGMEERQAVYGAPAPGRAEGLQLIERAIEDIRFGLSLIQKAG